MAHYPVATSRQDWPMEAAAGRFVMICCGTAALQTARASAS